MPRNTPSLEDFDNDAALGGHQSTPRRQTPRSGNAPRRRPTPDSTGPVAGNNGTQQRRRPRQRQSEKPPYTLMSFIRDERTHLAVGICLLLTAIVLFAATVSFIYSGVSDQSVGHAHSASEMAASGEQVNNIAGPAGFKLAEFLLIDTFGLASFGIVIYVLLLSLSVLHLRRNDFFSLTFRCFFTTAALSVIFGLISFAGETDGLFRLGGNHGHYINVIVAQYGDMFGCIIMSVLLLSILVAIFLHPLRAMVRRLIALIPKREMPEAVAEAEPDTLGAFNADSEAEDVDEPADEQEPVPAHDDHSRFMPPAALNEFDDKDTVPADADTQLSDGIEEKETATESDNDSTESDNDASYAMPDEAATEAPSASSDIDGPSMEIVNSTAGETSDAEAPDRNIIRDGDHIGIDQPWDPRASHSYYTFPSTELLIERPQAVQTDEAEQTANKELIVDTLRSYNIEIQHIKATIGPTVTLYEIVPAQGTRIAKIKSLEDDIAMSLSALGIRIIAPIPGKGTIGIEVPNKKPQIVSMRNMLESRKFRETSMRLPMVLGRTISNDIFMADLTKMPHMLVAGATGQGKSVGLNCIIASLLYSKHPDELKFVLIDPKMVEFSLYQIIEPQFLAKIGGEDNAVITEPSKVIDTLNSLCVEMDQRYELLRSARVKNLEEYNERFISRTLNPAEGHRYLPYIVMIVDEYADLVMTAGKDIAQPICRIAQKARAVGMHMIIATQRPSTDVITGMIKANFTARIAFKVTQSVDSKTILDRPGAQRLNGRGDMLTLINGVVDRVQCGLVETEEVEAICRHISEQTGFVGAYELPEPPADESAPEAAADITVTDEFRRCAIFIASQEQASITMMQRKFEIGFNKAGRYMDQMEQLGIVGRSNGPKPRQVLMSPDEVERLLS